MKIVYYILLAFIFTGCATSTTMVNEGVPPSMEFELERFKSPLTNTVPSHLKYEYLDANMVGNKHKATKAYPNTWTNVDDKFAALSVTQVVSDPTNPSIFYFCTGEGWFNADATRGAGVWKSADAGETWTQLQSTTSDTFHYCQDLLVHPITADVYVTTRSGGLLRSQNGGVSWQTVLGGGNGSLTSRAADLELTADNDIVVSMGIFDSDGIYISTTGDLGSWTKIVNGLPGSSYERIEIATAKSNANVMYCVPQNGSNNRILGVYKSTDKGANWVAVADPGGDKNFARVQSWYDLIIEVDPNNENVVVVGGLNIWKSTDAGDSWEQITEGDLRLNSPIQYVHVDQHNIVFQNSDTVYFTNDGGVYRCDNFTSANPIIYELNSNYNITQFYSCDIHPTGQQVIGGTQDNGSHGSLDYGISEFEKISWADGGYCAIDYKQPEYVYTTTQFRRVFRTRNGVQDTITNYLLQNNNTLFINPLIMDVNNPQTLFQASNNGVWRMDNARTGDTASWRKICRSFGSITALATSKSSENTLYFARTGGGAFRIDNSHLTDENYIPAFMDQNDELPGGYLNCIVTDPLDANHVIAIYSNYDLESVFETYDAFAADPTWVSCEGNLPNIPILWGVLQKGSSEVLYVGTELGVYYTEKLDGVNTVWLPSNKGLPNVRISQIKYRDGDEAYVCATHGRGIFIGKRNGNEIEWSERGPSNIGGRTRTIMFDPNDPTQKKIWAGGVSGGLWVVNNIDSVSYFDLVPESTELNAYPNPVSDFLTLAFDEFGANEVEVDIFNNLGQRVADLLFRDEVIVYLDVSFYESGIYYVRMQQGENQKTVKIIKVED